MSLSFLQTIGLTENEANLYELLLRLGEVPAGKLITEAKIRRATAYKSLYSLESKHLVTHRDVGKILHFRPEAPTELLAYSERSLQAQERAREDLRRLLPEITSLYTLSVERPVVSIFEGVEGLKKIYDDTIKEGKDISAVLQTGTVHEELFKWLTTTYIRNRVKAGIQANVIVSSGTWSETYREKDKRELRTTLLVPSARFPFQHEVDVYGSKVAFINYKKGEALIGVVINHPQIAQTMKSWFSLAWEGAGINPFK